MLSVVTSVRLSRKFSENEPCSESVEEKVQQSTISAFCPKLACFQPFFTLHFLPVLFSYN